MPLRGAAWALETSPTTLPSAAAGAATAGASGTYAATPDGPTAELAAPPAPMLQVAEPPDAWDGWYTVGPTVMADPVAGAHMIYRWDYGPGPWERFPGVVVPPSGRHTLQVVQVAANGMTSDPSTLDFKVDAFATSMVQVYQSPQAAQILAAARPRATSGVRVRAVVMPQAGALVKRIGGPDRYAVSVGVSKNNFTKASTVIVATGEKFPDALAASPLAGCVKGPILLTRARSLPSGLASEIRRLGATKAIIVGGPGSVFPSVEAQLRGLHIAVERIGGADRYYCAANIAARVLSYKGNSGRVFVARGDVYPDALALGPLAYTGRTPILLTWPSALPAPTRSCLQRNHFSTAFVAGGTGSITPAVFNQIDSYVGKTTRIPGRDRYECAANIAVAGISAGLAQDQYVGIATGEKFPDALTGGVGAGQMNGTILLTRLNVLPPASRSFITHHKLNIQRVDGYGGPASVSDAVLNQVRALLK